MQAFLLTLVLLPELRGQNNFLVFFLKLTFTPHYIKEPRQESITWFPLDSIHSDGMVKTALVFPQKYPHSYEQECSFGQIILHLECQLWSLLKGRHLLAIYASVTSGNWLLHNVLEKIMLLNLVQNPMEKGLLSLLVLGCREYSIGINTLTGHMTAVQVTNLFNYPLSGGASLLERKTCYKSFFFPPMLNLGASLP